MRREPKSTPEVPPHACDISLLVLFYLPTIGGRRVDSCFTLRRAACHGTVGCSEVPAVRQKKRERLGGHSLFAFSGQRAIREVLARGPVALALREIAARLGFGACRRQARRMPSWPHIPAYGSCERFASAASLPTPRKSTWRRRSAHGPVGVQPESGGYAACENGLVIQMHRFTAAPPGGFSKALWSESFPESHRGVAAGSVTLPAPASPRRLRHTQWLHWSAGTVRPR